MKKLVLACIKMENKGDPGNFWKNVRKAKGKTMGLERRNRNQRGLWKDVNFKDAWKGL